MQKQLRLPMLGLFGLLLLLTSCSSSRPLSRKNYRELSGKITESPVFSKQFTGFLLFDPVDGDTLFAQDSDKYFTPASNIKLFTLLTSLKVLGDSLPALRYASGSGFLFLQGTGSPLFLHPDFPQDKVVWDFLNRTPAQLFFSDENMQDERFAPGWAWEDYQYSFQPEKSSLPIYGNLVFFEKKEGEHSIRMRPSVFKDALRYDPQLDGRTRPLIQRREHTNQFFYNKNSIEKSSSFERAIPVYQAQQLIPALLTDTLNRTVVARSVSEEEFLPFKTLQQPLPDTLLRQLMQDSDNFIADQLLLACSAKQFDGQLNTRRLIRYALDSLFADMPDPPRWLDGSGLSRYNLCTPRSIVYVLHQLYQELPAERLFDIFPAGGQSGTIKNRYGAKDEAPWLYAKTGTLGNIHALSGYLRTDSGRILIFSFMNNHYMSKAAPVQEEMEQVLRWVKQW